MLTHPNFADNLTPVPPPQRLHYFWERQCDISPDAIALICEQEQLTYLEDLSMLPPEQRIPSGEIWVGSPAAKLGINADKTTSRIGRLQRIYFGSLQALLLMTLPILELVPILPGVRLRFLRRINLSSTF